MKKDIKVKSGKKRLFSKENKRAYIALLVLAVLVGISITARNRAMKSELPEEQTAFDDEAWRAAVAESGVILPEKIEEEEPQPEVTEPAKAVSAEVVPQTDPEPEWQEYTETVAVAAQEELTFIRPSKGSVLNDYSGEELVYSETMEDWRTHNGIDFAAAEGDQVIAAGSGAVKKVYKDDLLGITVEIEHSNGVISRYSGLQSLDFIAEGKTVSAGDIIGGVGANGSLELESEPHLHFEVIKNGEYENPNLYFAK